VRQDVNLLDTTTQQNRVLVEQSAAASESMQKQAVALSGAVGVFRLECETSPDVAAARRCLCTPARLAVKPPAEKRRDSGVPSIGSLSDRARNNYFYARTVIGREVSNPAVQESR
jgi:methyl-accepting chemotaxis protein